MTAKIQVHSFVKGSTQQLHLSGPIQSKYSLPIDVYSFVVNVCLVHCTFIESNIFLYKCSGSKVTGEILVYESTVKHRRLKALVYYNYGTKLRDKQKSNHYKISNGPEWTLLLKRTLL